MFESFVPSLVIAASTVVAFVVGRLIAWTAHRTRSFRIVRVLVVLLSIAAAAFFVWSRSSRYALLLPAAFVVGFVTHHSGRIAPGLFDRKD